MTAQKPGFAKYQIDNVVVEVTSEKRVDVQLSVAGSDTVVLVAPAAQGFLPITVTPDVGIGNPFLGGGGSRNIQFALRLAVLAGMKRGSEENDPRNYTNEHESCFRAI